MGTGFEPVYTALQAAASPLGQPTIGTALAEPGADDGTRTRDPHLGKVMLYQLSHIRKPGFPGRSAVVGDTGFEPVTSSVSGKRATTAPIALMRSADPWAILGSNQ